MTTEPMEILRRAVERDGQSSVARQIGWSATVVNRVLSGKYPGDVAAVLDAVVVNYGAERVECPVLGSLSRKECHEHRTRPFAATNPKRVRIWKACRSCEVKK